MYGIMNRIVFYDLDYWEYYYYYLYYYYYYLDGLLQSAFNRSASNRHNRASKAIGNRIFHAIGSIGQSGQSANRPSFPIGQSRYLFNVANRAMSSIYWQHKYVWTNVEFLWRLTSDWKILPITPDWNFLSVFLIAQKTHWTDWTYQSGQSAIGF